MTEGDSIILKFRTAQPVVFAVVNGKIQIYTRATTDKLDRFTACHLRKSGEFGMQDRYNDMNENTNQPCEVKMPQINEWIIELHQAISSANDVSNELRERLSPLIRCRETENHDKDPDRPEEELVDLADRIRSAVRFINSTTQNNRETLRLLEI